MILNREIINWVEYTICEKTMDIYPKSKSVSSNYNTFCKRLRDSILKDNLSPREENMLTSIMQNTNRQYCLSDKEISVICANFFIDERWDRYMYAIELMNVVRWKLPDKRFPKF